MKTNDWGDIDPTEKGIAQSETHFNGHQLFTQSVLCTETHSPPERHPFKLCWSYVCLSSIYILHLFIHSVIWARAFTQSVFPGVDKWSSIQPNDNIMKLHTINKSAKLRRVQTKRRRSIGTFFFPISTHPCYINLLFPPPRVYANVCACSPRGINHPCIAALTPEFTCAAHYLSAYTDPI